ncbi:oocyte zinc finger protein XlCOF6-like [Dunckerocampus dactyliophorus]|uniref:oocyte zinc finger protein XlCOF6-like n=1 Tax=Dunckerocampus dactyliophorus TaxID=161453 RepID=UPI00240645C2|nr:oocyte zinc finger protein XlCOF6-like [Dunckerocampus dactyliophorus]
MNHCYAKMATSSQREGGRESAPPTPIKSSMEKKPQTADNDMQQLIGCQEECSPQLQGTSSTLKQGDPQPPHVKKEEEELWTAQEREYLPGQEEADLTKLPLTAVSVKTEDHEDKPPDSSRWLCPADVQQLVGHPEECPPEPQGLSSTLKQADSQFFHVKNEEVELWTTQEGECLVGPEEADLTKLPLTVVSVKTENHEDKPHESSRWLCPADVQQVIGCQEERPPHLQGGCSTLKKEDGQPPHVKEEEGELWTTQNAARLLGPEEADLTKLPLTVVSVKTEDHEDKSPECSLLHHSPSEENRGAEPPSSSSPQHMTTEADGDHCGGSQADNLLAPLSDSDDTTSHSPEDRNNTQEPLSSNSDCEGDMRIQTDTKHSKCSKKKTRKKNWTCSVCSKSFSCRGHLARHMVTHTGEKPFNCSVCAKSFSLKGSLNRHMLMHTGEKTIFCSVCGQRFFQKVQMVSHMRKHTGEKPFSCSICAKGFSLQCYLTRHMVTHTGEKPFSCSVCAKSFSLKPYLTRHMVTHTGEKPFCCSVCGQRFSLEEQMVSHKRKHTGKKTFSCSICGKIYYIRNSLAYHMRKHTGENPFGCSVCGQRFNQKSLMVSHMRKHTGEKPFSCSVCGKNYSFRSSLSHHMRKHTEEKPFLCSVCGQRFTQMSLMVSHMRKHTGEKPFSCSVCGKNYSFRNSLTYHMQRHKEKKPFSCSVCSKKFSVKQALIYHAKICRGLGSAKT